VFVQDIAIATYQCIHFVTKAEAVAPTDIKRAGLELAHIDAGNLVGERDLLSSLAAELRFPSYYGVNWDALDECLRDLSWLPARGYVIQVSKAAEMWLRLTPTAGKLIEVSLAAAEAWAGKGVSFHLVFVV